MAYNILTDKMMAQLYDGMHKHYQSLEKQQLNPLQICERMNISLTENLYYLQNSELYHLSPLEKNKAYAVLNSYIKIHAAQYPATQDWSAFIENAHQQIKTANYVYIDHHYCDRRYGSDLLWDLALINLATSRSHCHYGSSSHSNSSNNSDCGEVLAGLALVLVVGLAVVISMIAFYYLLNELLHSFERIWHSEGSLQALVTLASMGAASLASAMLANIFLSAPIASLAIAAGLASAVVPVVIGIIAATLVGASIVTFITNKAQETLIQRTNQDAFDPKDPHRYELTASEIANLERNGIDPVKVKVAILELRLSMKKPSLPYYLHRVFSSGENAKIHQSMEKIRDLRAGKLRTVDINGRQFDCQRDLFSHSYCQQPNSHVSRDVYVPSDGSAYNQHNHGHPSQQTNYFPQPSAPPAY
jgi:hypothetical protein